MSDVMADRLPGRTTWIFPYLVALSASASSCGGPLIGVTIIDEKTALENQVLGSYEELSKEVLLVASVRYINPEGRLVARAALPPAKEGAIRAMQRSAFNKDDIDRLKTQGILGENNEGGITILAPEKIAPERRAFVNNLVAEENADREVLIQRILATNEKLTPGDLPRVRRTFAALNRDRARPGDFVQLESGQWIQKPNG
jgi:uncharacterized protein YdbL (DUF1318 family)